MNWTARQTDLRRQRREANPETANTYNRAWSLESRKRAPWKRMLKGAKERAAARGIEFSLTPEWAAERYTGRCEVTDIEFRLYFGTAGPRAFSPSIDRIDQAQGYTPTNCRFVLFAVNAIRGTLSDSELLFVAARIVASPLFADLAVIR